jgi:tagatose-6-phosphate ketose/aldose isomerase
VLNNSELEAFLEMALADPNRPILVSGAGSSEFVGLSVMECLSKNLERIVLNAPTTDLVTSAEKFCRPLKPSLMISFARSGNSPESVASYHFIKELEPSCRHLIITCNSKGSLALSGLQDKNSFVLLLPEETNDQSLVMTSSFSSMVLATMALGYFHQKEQAYSLLKLSCHYTNLFLSDKTDPMARSIIQQNINRVCYLGSDAAKGLLTEAALKMLEMSDGQCVSRVDSFLGFRHGPQVFAGKHCLVCAVLSEDENTRRYELDLLAEMQRKGQGAGYLVIGPSASKLDLPKLIAFESEGLGPFFRIFPAIVVLQMLAFYKSMALGLSPDAPSASGIINRVVEGVTIYKTPQGKD